MEYIKRHAEATVNMLSKMFGAILVAGPRQVGKTTMLQRITEGMNYATLDDLIVRAAAQEQSGTFFKDNPPPVFVDEIQKAPELFSQIKMFIDREHKKGQFFMCGSQQFQMMKGVSESLSGRIGLVTPCVRGMAFPMTHRFCRRMSILMSAKSSLPTFHTRMYGRRSTAALCRSSVRIRILIGRCFMAHMCEPILNAMFAICLRLETP